MHLPKCSLRTLALLLALALLGACAGINNRPSPAQEAAASHAQTLQDQGRYADAARAWQALAAQHRSWRDTYLLHAAENLRQLDDWSAAAPILATVRRGHLTGADATHFDLLRAEAALAANNPTLALQLTANADALPAAWRLRALELKARAEAGTAQPLAAARTRLLLDASLAGFDREQNQKQLLDLLTGMDVEKLQRAASTLPAHDPLRVWIADALKAKGSALAAPSPELQHPVGTLLPGIGNAVSVEGYAPPGTVALVLPAGGPLGAAAAAVQDGFTTAWHRHPDKSHDMQLIVLDSAGTPAGALAAYRQAVAADADLVVGPLAPDAVTALFREGPLPVPVLALNHPSEGLPPTGSVEFSLPPEAEGAQVAERMRAQGLIEAVMFMADADWAQRAGHAFRAQFESAGGHIIGTATLATTEVDYAAAIAALMANAGSTTGVFIAMRPRQGRLLVPQLRIAQVSQPLFATSHIYSAQTDPGLNRDLDGVVFCDAPWLFDAQPGLIRRSKLAEDNPNARGPAARLFAFGMDAWALMPYLDWMRAHPGSYLAGATGQLTMDGFGRIHRIPIWARFVNGVAEPVTGALQASNASTGDLPPARSNPDTDTD